MKLKLISIYYRDSSQQVYTLTNPALISEKNVLQEANQRAT